MPNLDALSRPASGYGKKVRVVDLGDNRVSAETAGYMELDGAKKDSDCETVRVKGGISSEKGCCNLFAPHPHADKFHCNDCTHIKRGK